MTNKRLKKDIVIPAGTIFDCYEDMTLETRGDTYCTTIGLTKDSAGDLIYGIDPSDSELDDWFEDIE